MSLPKFSSKFGIYSLSWPDLGVAMKLDHFRESHDSISAEWSIFQPTPQGNQHLHTARLGLLSTSGKEALIKKLHSFSNTFDWPLLVEQAAALAIREYRRGEPVVQIGQHPLSTTPLWRLKPIAPEGMVSSLFGPGGAGKTTLCLAFCYAVQHGWTGLGLAPVQGNVLYLDWEGTEAWANDTLLALEAGLEWPEHPAILYRHCDRPLTEMVEEIQATIADRAIKFVVVDSAMKAAGGEENATKNAGPTLNALRSLRVSVLVVAHTVKHAEEDKKSPYGSIFWTWDPRHVLEIKTVADEENDALNIGIYRHKSNVVSAKMKPLGLRVTWDEAGAISITTQDIAEVPELAMKLPIKLQIVKALSSGPLAVKELADTLGLDKSGQNTIRMTLNRFRSKQFVKLPSEGKEVKWANLSFEKERIS